MSQDNFLEITAERCYDMRIFYTGMVRRMSAVIGICGMNFCTFISDGRLVVSGKNGWVVASDKARKIERINDRLIYGATGIFLAKEDLLDPLNVYSDKSGLTMRLAHKAVLDHIEKIKYDILGSRNYMIGGKDNKGNFCIVEIHIDADSHDVKSIIRTPVKITEGTSSFGISCALPSGLSSNMDYWIDRVWACVSGSVYHKDMVEKASTLIREMASLDETIGRETYALTVQ